MLNRIKGKKTVLSLVALFGVLGLTFGESTTSQGKAPTIDMREDTYQDEITNIEGDLEESDTEDELEEESEEGSQLSSSKNESDSQVKVNVTDGTSN